MSGRAEVWEWEKAMMLDLELGQWPLYGLEWDLGTRTEQATQMQFQQRMSELEWVQGVGGEPS